MNLADRRVRALGEAAWRTAHAEMVSLTLTLALALALPLPLALTLALTLTLTRARCAPACCLLSCTSITPRASWGRPSRRHATHAWRPCITPPARGAAVIRHGADRRPSGRAGAAALRASRRPWSELMSEIVRELMRELIMRELIMRARARRRATQRLRESAYAYGTLLLASHPLLFSVASSAFFSLFCYFCVSSDNAARAGARNGFLPATDEGQALRFIWLTTPEPVRVGRHNERRCECNTKRG